MDFGVPVKVLGKISQKLLLKFSDKANLLVCSHLELSERCWKGTGPLSERSAFQDVLFIGKSWTSSEPAGAHMRPTLQMLRSRKDLFLRQRERTKGNFYSI